VVAGRPVRSTSLPLLLGLRVEVFDTHGLGGLQVVAADHSSRATHRGFRDGMCQGGVHDSKTVVDEEVAAAE